MTRPAYLDTLLEIGVIAHSVVNAAVLAELTTLNLVAVESHKSRRRVIVINPEAFARWLNARYPPAPADVDGLPLRAQNVARSRSSKSGSTTHNIQPIILRWFGPSTHEPAVLTTRYGLLAATSERVHHLPFPAGWRLLLVENWESFYNLDYPPFSPPVVAVYLGGQVAQLLLDTLAALYPIPASILCFVDYDWTGLGIFARIRTCLPAARLYLPPDLESLFSRYARPDLATNQPPFLDVHPDSRPVVHLIQQYNAGLEQEIVPSPPIAAFAETATN